MRFSRRSLVLLGALFVMPGVARADEVPQSFAHLRKVETDDTGSLYVHPKQACVPKVFDEEGPAHTELCQLAIGSKTVVVEFSNGPSDDPAFLLRVGEESLLLPGTSLYAPGGASIYVSGWTNSFHPQRRKFTFDGRRFVEVVQPFEYVGIKSRVTHIGEEGGSTTVTLFADKEKKGKVAVLPEGSEIEVLLADRDDWYLVRTSFGLVGWYSTHGSLITPIGLVFAGD